ncbi:MAG TPA: Bax inhibitor-1/YccA family protein [Actinomycetales bacterium]|nr:Bax inhibitor-1/YccA family protein [Actinomycetales bacterium]
MSNPVFSRIEKDSRGYATFHERQRQEPQGQAYGTPSPVQLEKMYAAPSATSVDTGRVTVDDVIVKTGIQFVLLLASAAVAWQVTSGDLGRAMGVWLVSMFAGLALGLVIAFKRSVSVPLIVAYAVIEGVFVGTISQVFDNMMGPQYHGVVGQAVIGTLAVFGGMLLAYKTGLIKVNDKFRRIMMFALIGYAIVALASLVGAFMGVGGGWGFYGVGGLGLLLCVFGVGLAAVTLALDFNNIDRAVAAGMPQKYSWLLGHGLIVTLVWLYIELLRLLAILRGDN